MPQTQFSLFSFRRLLALALLVATIAFVISKNQPRTEADLIEFPQPKILSAFQLKTGKNGKAAFSQINFHQHWTLLFFGFTHCSEICPTTLAVLAQAYQTLQSDYPNLQVVFISLDSAHDSPKGTQAYASSFNKNFIGASGKPEQVRILQQQLGVFIENKPNPSTHKLNHSSAIYIINPQGQWQALLPSGLTATQVQSNLQLLIDQSTHV